ncbi:MAG: hypothetical protein ACE5H8_11770 [Alphaproteobacteria bacterium]
MRRSLAAVLLVLSAATLPAAAQQAANEESKYNACAAQARSDAEAAYDTALTWRDAGGGAPARHCMALALITMGRFAEAAEQLEALAQDMHETRPVLQGQLLGQAGQAWLRARNAERAVAALGGALEIDPKNIELLIDRALAFAARGAYWEAIDDLNAAADIEPGRAEIYAFRASAYRYVDAIELAAEDIDRSLRLKPGAPIALLERGNIRRLRGDDKGARADWLDVLDKAPGTPAAEAAQNNLERLDVNTQQ